MSHISRLAIVVSAGLLITGCNLSLTEEYPSAPLQRIHVVQRPAVLTVNAGDRTGVLAREDYQRVAGFLDAYREGGRGLLSISLSSRFNGGGERHRIDHLKAELATLARRRGIPAAAIEFREVPSGTDLITLAYVDSAAIKPPCGFEKGFATTWANRTSENFGCALEGSIATVIANPADLEAANPMVEADTTRSNKVVGDYRQGKVTNAQQPQQGQGIAKFGNQ